MEFDFLVIGSGIAGLSFALEAARSGTVGVVTKDRVPEASSSYAQGGIASVWSPEDSFAAHAADTEEAGAGLCDPEIVRLVVEEGPERVREMIALGTRFSLRPDAEDVYDVDLGLEGGHSQRRILHALDATGREMMRALLEAVGKNPSIRILERHMAVDLLLGSKFGVPGPEHCWGAYVLDVASGEVRTIRARATLLATGGAGKVYLYTSNPDVATGDGVAIAYRAGAPIANMEFIQFHPTTLYHPEARSFLISEAVRGEGGILKLRDGTPFMERYHPMASLAPRDIVARAIDTELKRTGDDYVYLDVTHLDPDFIRDRFPNIYERCLEFGIDITSQPIPIVPAAHYSCGGVLTDLEARTSLHRLYAVGEVACTGVHGANRLASNSLLEALVFADHAAADTRELLEREPPPEAPSEPEAWMAANHPDRQGSEVSPEFAVQLRTLTQTLMLAHVGIVRTDRRLRQAFREIDLLRNAVESLFATSRVTPELLELRNIVQVGWLIIECALRRKESRGLHFNSDYPERDDEHWLHDTILEPPTRT